MNPIEMLQKIFDETKTVYTMVSNSEIIIECESMFIPLKMGILPQKEIIKKTYEGMSYEDIDFSIKIHIEWDGENLNWLVVSESEFCK